MRLKNLNGYIPRPLCDAVGTGWGTGAVLYIDAGKLEDGENDTWPRT
jgi:hypothetical protein